MEVTKPKQSWLMSHAETICQNVFGLLIAQLICYLFGIPLKTALGLAGATFVASYIRSYIIRRIFTRLN